MSADHEDIAALLDRVRAGDDAARNRLVTLVYPELKRLARILMSRERQGHTFGTTGSALVHELYEARLGPETTMRELAKAKDDKDVIRILGRDMRQILIDHARAGQAIKRPPKGKQDPLENAQTVDGSEVFSNLYSVEVQQAMDALREVSAESEYAVELKWAAGFTYEEGAAAMGLTVAKFRSLVAYGTAWLRDYFSKKS
jgi:RNA polymerase sigma factor (TIGR02999 family)